MNVSFQAIVAKDVTEYGNAVRVPPIHHSHVHRSIYVGSFHILGHILYRSERNTRIGKEKEIMAMERGGNKRVNSIFEATLLQQGGAGASVQKPNPASSQSDRDTFCRIKYIDRKFYDSSAYAASLVSSTTVGVVPKQRIHRMSHPHQGAGMRRRTTIMTRQNSMPSLQDTTVAAAVAAAASSASQDDGDVDPRRGQQQGNKEKLLVPMIDVIKVAISDVDFDFHCNRSLSSHDDWFLNSPEQSKKVPSPSLRSASAVGTIRRERDELATTWHPPSPRFNERTKERIKATNIVMGRSVSNIAEEKGIKSHQQAHGTASSSAKLRRMNGLTRRLSSPALFQNGDNLDFLGKDEKNDKSQHNIEETVRSTSTSTSASRRKDGLVRQHSSPALREGEDHDQVAGHPSGGVSDVRHSSMRSITSGQGTRSRRRGPYYDSMSCSWHSNAPPTTNNAESDIRGVRRKSNDASTKARLEMMRSGSIDEHHDGEFDIPAPQESSSLLLDALHICSNGDTRKGDSTGEQKTALKSHTNQRKRESGHKDTNRRSITEGNTKRESQSGKGERPVPGKEKLITEIIHCLQTTDTAETAPLVLESSKSVGTLEPVGQGDKINPTATRQRRSQVSLMEQTNPRSRSRSRSKSRKSNFPRRKKSDEFVSSSEAISTRRKVVPRVEGARTASMSPTRSSSNAGASAIPPSENSIVSEEPLEGGASSSDRVTRTSRGTSLSRQYRSRDRLSTQSIHTSRSRSKSRDARKAARQSKDDPEVPETCQPEMGHSSHHHQPRTSTGPLLRRGTRVRDRADAQSSTCASPVRSKSRDTGQPRTRDSTSTNSTGHSSPVRSKSRDTGQTRTRDSNSTKSTGSTSPIRSRSRDTGRTRTRDSTSTNSTSHSSPVRSKSRDTGRTRTRDSTSSKSAGSKSPVRSKSRDAGRTRSRDRTSTQNTGHKRGPVRSKSHDRGRNTSQDRTFPQIRSKSQERGRNSRSQDRTSAQITTQSKTLASPVRSKSRDAGQRRLRRVTKTSNVTGAIPRGSFRGQHPSRARTDPQGMNNSISVFGESSFAFDMRNGEPEGIPAVGLIWTKDSSRPKANRVARNLAARHRTSSDDITLTSKGISITIVDDNIRVGLPKSYTLSQECR
jgi:hypothetical protein